MRDATLYRILMNLAAAASVEADLPMVLREMVADEKEWPVRQGMVSLADQIEGGASVAEAVEKLPAKLPPHLAAMIRHGEDSGQMMAMLTALQRLHISMGEFAQSLRRPVMFIGLLPGAVAMMLLAVALPAAATYRDIYAMGGLELPLPLLWLATLADWLTAATLGSPMLVMAVIIAGVVLLGTALAHWVVDRYPDRLPALRRLIAIAGEVHLAECLRGLVATGIPAHDALALAGGASPLAPLRGNLLALSEALERGQPASEVPATGLSPRFADALEYGLATGDLSGHLEDLATEHRRYLATASPRVFTGLTVMSQIAVGLAVLAGGGTFAIMHFGSAWAL